MLTYLDRFRELSPESLVLRLVLAMLIGGYLGLERERKKTSCRVPDLYACLHGRNTHDDAQPI